MAPQLIAVADLRARLAAVVDELGELGAPLYVTQRGQARAVLVSVDAYDALVEQIEYLDDSLEALKAKERRESGAERTRDWASAKVALGRRGRVPRRATAKR